MIRGIDVAGVVGVVPFAWVAATEQSLPELRHLPSGAIAVPCELLVFRWSRKEANLPHLSF